MCFKQTLQCQRVVACQAGQSDGHMQMQFKCHSRHFGQQVCIAWQCRWPSLVRGHHMSAHRAVARRTELHQPERCHCKDAPISAALNPSRILAWAKCTTSLTSVQGPSSAKGHAERGKSPAGFSAPAQPLCRWHIAYQWMVTAPVYAMNSLHLHASFQRTRLSSRICTQLSVLKEGHCRLPKLWSCTVTCN